VPEEDLGVLFRPGRVEERPVQLERVGDGELVVLEPLALEGAQQQPDRLAVEVLQHAFANERQDRPLVGGPEDAGCAPAGEPLEAALLDRGRLGSELRDEPRHGRRRLRIGFREQLDQAADWHAGLAAEQQERQLQQAVEVERVRQPGERLGAHPVGPRHRGGRDHDVDELRHLVRRVDRCMRLPQLLGSRAQIGSLNRVVVRQICR
jgi:hypothetical protein